MSRGKVDYAGAITFDCESVIAVKPSSRGRSVATRLMVDLQTHRFDRGYAFQKPGSRDDIIATHNDGGA